MTNYQLFKVKKAEMISSIVILNQSHYKQSFTNCISNFVKKNTKQGLILEIVLRLENYLKNMPEPIILSELRQSGLHQ